MSFYSFMPGSNVRVELYSCAYVHQLQGSTGTYCNDLWFHFLPKLFLIGFAAGGLIIYGSSLTHCTFCMLYFTCLSGTNVWYDFLFWLAHVSPFGSPCARSWTELSKSGHKGYRMGQVCKHVCQSSDVTDLCAKLEYGTTQTKTKSAHSRR